MENNYNWSIISMNSYPEYESQQNVVFQVYWSCTGVSPQVSSSTNQSYEATVNGLSSVTYEAGTPFTPYSQLTQNQVIGWVQSSLGTQGVLDVQSSCDQQINNQTNPPPQTLPLPWAATASVSSQPAA